MNIFQIILLKLIICIAAGQDCLCDLTSDLCDEYCCCDSSCSTIKLDNKLIVDIWDKQKRCSNLIYAGSYNIPNCNREYQKSTLDLYQGLRIAYNLFKNLGCVTTSNSNANQMIEQSTIDQTILNQKNTYLLSSAQQQTNIYELALLNSSFIVTYPRSQYDNICTQSKLYDLKPYPPKWCLTYLNSANTYNLTQYNTNYYLFNTQVTLDSTNTYLFTYDTNSTKRLQLKSIGNVEQSADGSTTVLSFLVVGGIYYIEETDNATSSTSRVIKSIKFQPFIIDQVSVSNGKFVIPRFFGVVYYSSESSVYEVSGQNGYERGSYVRFKKSYTEELVQPLYIGIESENGNCANYTDTSISLAKPFEIRFLQDQKITCTKIDVGFSASSFVKGPSTNFIKIAQFGDSESNNTQEWIDVSQTEGSCTSAQNQMEIQISYQPFGERGKERYKIVKCSLVCSSDMLDTTSYALQVRFYEVPTPYTHYKAPAPQLVGGLPNDVLAPFIIY